MDATLGFEIGPDCCARQLWVEKDRALVACLGRRCAEYLRQTLNDRCHASDLTRLFVNTLWPRSGPVDGGVVLGIFRPAGGQEEKPTHLAGVLYFLRPAADPGTWYIALLLLEPCSRSRGIGSAVNAAFARWAAARGAQRLTAMVCGANRRALHFWRDRLQYAEKEIDPSQRPGAAFRGNHKLEYRLTPVYVPAPWLRQRAA